jgi:hypothetical protein
MKNWMVLVAGAAIAAGCSQQKAMTKVDDSGLARLNEQQMQPVDDARVEEGRAQDAVARAKAAEADARAQLEVGKSDKDVADARLKRSIAERDLLKKQYAPRDQQTRAEEQIQSAQDAVKAAELKAQYLNQYIAVRQAELAAAEAHLATTRASTQQIKYRAMKAGDAPQASATNPGDVDQQLANARSHEAELERRAAEQRSAAVELYNKWQQADSRSRMLAQPDVKPPPPVGK